MNWKKRNRHAKNSIASRAFSARHAISTKRWVACFALCLMWACHSVVAEKEVKQGERLGANEGSISIPSPTAQPQATSWNVAHSALQDVFNQIIIVDAGSSQVSYRTLAVANDLKAQFGVYLTWLKTGVDLTKVLGPSATQSEKDKKKAFWINAYNACLINHVYQNLASIGDSDVVAYQMGGKNLFDLAICHIGNQSLSLNQIETGVLRNAEQRGLIQPGHAMALPSTLPKDHDFSSPATQVSGQAAKFDRRIHYALSCGAVSCPPLSPELFSSSNTERKLTLLEQNFWSHAREATTLNLPQARVNAQTLYVNPLFTNWYKNDFPDLSTYLGSLLTADKASLVGAGVGTFSHNWKLNKNTTKSIICAHQYSYSEML